MRSRRFGPLAARVPVIGLGTWKMERDDATAAAAAIARALELGMVHVDTAEMYGNGIVEMLVGKALAGKRDRAFLVSKVLPSNSSHQQTIAACEDSLSRLATDHLDLYLLHWRGQVPLAETFGAFEVLREQGKIRAWGVSNFDVDDLEEALALVGPGKIACNQVLYHLGDRTIEHAVIPWCERNNVAVVGYSPFGSRRGFPSGGTLAARSARSSRTRTARSLSSARVPKAQALAMLAEPLGATPRQLALAFLARRAFVIPKSANVAHVEQIAPAADLELDAATIHAIDAAFPLGPWRGLPSI